MDRRGGAWVLAAVLILATGCASSGWPKFIGPDHLKTLVGTWQGGLAGQTAGLLPMGVTVNPDGSYVVTAEAYSSRGLARVSDGRLVFQPDGAGGTASPEPTAATLSQRDDGTLVLTGSGRSAPGPFSFVVTKTK
jgi:hypothetical protein